MLSTSDTCSQLHAASEAQQQGIGPPSASSRLRLFDAQDESEVRVTLYRDDAAWCPYCQKVWLLLEEKRIPYKTATVPLNAYGYKPTWFNRMVDGGNLPAITLDGEVHVESIPIMKLLDTEFDDHGPRMVPIEGSADAALAQRVLDLELELTSRWFSLTFYPVENLELEWAAANFCDALRRTDALLGERSESPWFLGGESPSYVDLQVVTHIERMVPSVLYWKGLQMRAGKDKDDQWPHLERWLRAFEARPAYLATKSDYYTHIKALPSQNGPGYTNLPSEDSKAVSARIDGLDGGWEWEESEERSTPAPLALEPLAPLQATGGECGARHEAAYALITNHESVVPFACRGASAPGVPAFHAELADPEAAPNEEYVEDVDLCLRHVSSALLESISAAEDAAKLDLGALGGSGELANGWDEYEDDDGRTYYYNDETGETRYGAAPSMDVSSCLAYLRDRVGVPRDMGPAAAMALRAHLNWAIALVEGGEEEGAAEADGGGQVTCP